jgi:hypothetical protein
MAVKTACKLLGEEGKNLKELAIAQISGAEDIASTLKNYLFG